MAEKAGVSGVSVPASASASKYSSPVAFAYIFNLIVGVGVLALPQAFNKSGLLLGTVLLVVLCLVSFVSACYIIESMAAANAFQKMKARREKVNDLAQRARVSSLSHQSYGKKSTEIEEGSSVHGSMEKLSPTSSPSINDTGGIPSHCIDVSGVHNPESKEEDVSITEVTPLLQPASDSDDDFEINEKYELGTMADMFYPKVGVVLYYICMCIYLFGDLSIYAVTAPASLTLVTCDLYDYYSNNSNNNITWEKASNNSECFNELLQKRQVYYLYLAAFILCIGPFTFFNMTKTKLMQITTTILRYLAFGFMISLAFVRIGSGHHHLPEMADLSEFPGLFGVSIYSFMCQHSLPGMVTPMKSKRWIYKILVSDFALILFFYLFLAFTGSFAFLAGDMRQLYSLDFFDASGPIWKLIFGTYLALFPVFTLSATFPIISVTLRENIKSLLGTVAERLNGKKVTFPFVIDRIFLPLVVLVPPVAIAYSTQQIDILVTITGSFPGVGVQYIIPATLVLMVQYTMKKEFGKYKNPYKTPFSHLVVLVLVFVWSVASVALIIVDIALNPPKIKEPF